MSDYKMDDVKYSVLSDELLKSAASCVPVMEAQGRSKLERHKNALLGYQVACAVQGIVSDHSAVFALAFTNLACVLIPRAVHAHVSFSPRPPPSSPHACGRLQPLMRCVCRVPGLDTDRGAMGCMRAPAPSLLCSIKLTRNDSGARTRLYEAWVTPSPPSIRVSAPSPPPVRPHFRLQRVSVHGLHVQRAWYCVRWAACPSAKPLAHLPFVMQPVAAAITGGKRPTGGTPREEQLPPKAMVRFCVCTPCYAYPCSSASHIFASVNRANLGAHL